MAYPNPAECQELLIRHRVPWHIQEHSRQVCRVALVLGEALVAQGVPLQLPLLSAGALLHDIAKAATLANGGNHALLGAEWLTRLGYPQVADIVAQHVCLRQDPATLITIGEVELVNYADKRVRHTDIVSLAARFADLQQRYGRTPEARRLIAANARRSQVLEEKIFLPLNFHPDDIPQLVQRREL